MPYRKKNVVYIGFYTVPGHGRALGEDYMDQEDYSAFQREKDTQMPHPKKASGSRLLRQGMTWLGGLEVLPWSPTHTTALVVLMPEGATGCPLTGTTPPCLQALCPQLRRQARQLSTN